MSYMALESAQAPESVTRFLQHNNLALIDFGKRMRVASPPVIITSARGSSDNAAGYFKYLTEILTGIPCCSIGASVVSIYDAKLQVTGGLCVTISQSGKSPDVVALQDAARSAGALTVALVNVEGSPVARNADICLPLCAGPEQSVAATKSLIVSLAAGAAMVAHWLGQPALLDAVNALPDALYNATKIDWPEAVALAKAAESLYVLGRGPCLPIAAETALKLKETCSIHAEAYSVAEVMHGPLELLGKDFPVLVYSPNDQSRETTRMAVRKMRMTGAEVRVVGDDGLPFAPTGHALLDPISMIQTSYRFIEVTAQKLGRNPDRPRLLKKVTETM